MKLGNIYIANGVSISGVDAKDMDLHMTGENCHVWHSKFNRFCMCKGADHCSFCFNAVYGTWAGESECKST